MLVTRNDAIEMYARFCVARYGTNAAKRVRTQATRLGKKGDLDGEKIWKEVAVKIEIKQKSPNSPSKSFRIFSSALA